MRDENLDLAIDLSDQPNLGFADWQRLPKDIVTLILQILIRSDDHKDAFAFSRACRLFNEVYRYAAPKLIIQNVKPQFCRQQLHKGERDNNHSLDKLFGMCYFITLTRINNISINDRLIILQEIKKAFSYKLKLDLRANSVLDVIRHYFNWPKVNANVTVAEQEFALQFYQEFNANNFSYSRSDEHDLIMISEYVDNVNPATLTKMLENNLREFIEAINNLISYEATMEILRSRIPYQAAILMLDFFLDNSEQMKRAINNESKKIRLNTGKEIKSTLNGDDRRTALILLLLISAGLGVGLSGFLPFGLSYLEGMSKDGVRTFTAMAYSYFAFGAAVMLFFIQRTITRNCSQERLSKNCCCFCKGIRKKRIEVIDENSHLLINESQQKPECNCERN